MLGRDHNQRPDRLSQLPLHRSLSSTQEAIEFYQVRNNEKYKIYTKRNELFLKKTAVDEILRGKSGQLVSKKEDA